MMIRRISVLWFGMMLLCALNAQATGPSFATIKIVPIAADANGTIVFKTYSHINKSGATTLEGAEYGWLCVSSSGLWEEQLHHRIGERDASDLAAIHRYAADFKHRIDLTNPPQSLKVLIDRFGLKDLTRIDPITGNGRAAWRPGAICIDGQCTGRNLRQRTLHGYSSDGIQGTPVEALFFYNGVALFENRDELEAEKPIGAFFPIENRIQGQDVGFEEYDISGICIIEPP